jgi:hypothetical protein
MLEKAMRQSIMHKREVHRVASVKEVGHDNNNDLMGKWRLEQVRSMGTDLRRPIFRAAYRTDMCRHYGRCQRGRQHGEHTD